MKEKDGSTVKMQMKRMDVTTAIWQEEHWIPSRPNLERAIKQNLVVKDVQTDQERAENYTSA